MDALFDVDTPPAPAPEPKESQGVRRTKRQAADLAAGRHPLTGFGLHAEAAPHDDRSAEGRRCGDCGHRELVGRHGNRTYPKCTVGGGARMTHGEASDVRAWWPACREHAYGEAT